MILKLAVWLSGIALILRKPPMEGFGSNTANSFLCPLEKGGILFCNCRSVGMSVCRPCVDRSISFDPFNWSIPNLVQGLPSMSRWSLFIFKVTCPKVKVQPLFSAQCVVRSISFDPFTWSIPNLVQGLHPISSWSLSIFRAHVDRSRSNYSSEPSVVHYIYFNPLLTCFGQILLLKRG